MVAISNGSETSGTKSRPNVRAAERSPSPASASPVATAIATSRWSSTSGPWTARGRAAGLQHEVVHERARPGAARPLRDPHALQRAGAGERERVPRGDDEPLLAPPEVDDDRVAAREQRPRERRVVAAVGVAQVERGAVGVVAPQRGEAAEAPARADEPDRVADRAEDDRERGVVAPGEPERGAGAQEPLRGEVAARRDPRRPPRGEDEHARAREHRVGALDGRGRPPLVGGEPSHGRERIAGRHAVVDDPPGEPRGQVIDLCHGTEPIWSGT